MADSSGDRKRRWGDAKQSLQHGSRNSGRKGKDMGRKEWNRQPHNRRAENDERNAKRQKPDTNDANEPGALSKYSQEEIDAEARRPKHKVAVMIGYSGTGYRGMQINSTEKTIEGDLFDAFVAAGAISKANANDPKKSALVRCARTDKGVHASGNVISLKLIVEDPDIVSKINGHLSPQIRVWGIQRTVNSFSSYQACDSRWYEYLIPSHAFLPPHPSTYLAKQITESLAQTGDVEEYDQRQADVAGFWDNVEETSIRPIVDGLEDSIKDVVLKALYDIEAQDPSRPDRTTGGDDQETAMPKSESAPDDVPLQQHAAKVTHVTETDKQMETPIDSVSRVLAEAPAIVVGNSTTQEAKDVPPTASEPSTSEPQPDLHDSTPGASDNAPTTTTNTLSRSIIRKQAVDKAVKSLREAYISAKRAYRISPARLDRVASALETFVGTRNFHNYTIHKTFKDPSAKRHIKSFKLNREPILINGTEWLSLTIHGQSFMMHQIRKMVSMVALTVRCGCPVSRISETLGPDIVSVPKAPGLGLLLERPVFDSYNGNIATKFDREKIDFAKYGTELQEFKQREIYERIFREEEQTAAFQVFFNQIDAFKEPQFLYLTSEGLEAIKNIAATRMEKETSSNGVQALESDEDSESENFADGQ